MGKYKIYHIPKYIYKSGRVGKIGCTKNIKKRITANKRISVKAFDFWEVLEEYDCKYTAGKRERQLQIQYGYKQDTTEYHTVEGSTGGFTGRSHNEETKRTIASKVIGLKKHSDEFKKTLAERNSNRVWDKSTLERMSKERRGKGGRLTESDVRYIKSKYVRNEYGVKRIAKEMNISATHCREIVRGNNWSWVI